MSRLPTDREVLQCIYEMYESSYPGKALENGQGENDPFVSIDIREIARKLDCSPELLFGRLFYYLDQKYRYKQDNNAQVNLFHIQIDKKRHAVHFPYLASIYAEHEESFNKQFWPLAISVIALLFSIYTFLHK